MSAKENLDQTEQLKSELFEMQARQKKIEDELKMHKIVLENNRVGMKESLVDNEDFPRNDIDVFAVRTARSAIIMLENEARDLIDQMKSKLEELHSVSRP